MQTGRTDAPSNGADLEGWKAAFADDSGRQFGDIVASDAVLEGNVSDHPITGREAIWSVLKLSGSLYDRLEFTHEVVSSDRTYLEWEARGLGLQIWGLTALMKDTRRPDHPHRAAPPPARRRDPVLSPTSGPRDRNHQRRRRATNRSRDLTMWPQQGGRTL
jgi:hypothetical protein